VFTEIGTFHTTYVDRLLSRSGWIVHLVGFYYKFFCYSTGKSLSVETAVFDFRAPIYRVSQEECARLRDSVPYVKVYRYNPKHLYPKLNGYGDNG